MQKVRNALEFPDRGCGRGEEVRWAIGEVLERESKSLIDKPCKAQLFKGIPFGAWQCCIVLQ